MQNAIPHLSYKLRFIIFRVRSGISILVREVHNSQYHFHGCIQTLFINGTLQNAKLPKRLVFIRTSEFTQFVIKYITKVCSWHFQEMAIMITLGFSEIFTRYCLLLKDEYDIETVLRDFSYLFDFPLPWFNII